MHRCYYSGVQNKFQAPSYRLLDIKKILYRLCFIVKIYVTSFLEYHTKVNIVLLLWKTFIGNILNENIGVKNLSYKHLFDLIQH